MTNSLGSGGDGAERLVNGDATDRGLGGRASNAVDGDDEGGSAQIDVVAWPRSG